MSAPEWAATLHQFFFTILLKLGTSCKKIKIGKSVVFENSNIELCFIPVFRIRIQLNPDTDPAKSLNPDLNPESPESGSKLPVFLETTVSEVKII